MDSRIVSIMLQVLILGVCLATFFALVENEGMKKEQPPQFTGQTVGKKLANGLTAEVKRQVGESNEDFAARLEEAIAIAESAGGE